MCYCLSISTCATPDNKRVGARSPSDSLYLNSEYHKTALEYLLTVFHCFTTLPSCFIQPTCETCLTMGVQHYWRAIAKGANASEYGRSCSARSIQRREGGGGFCVLPTAEEANTIGNSKISGGKGPGLNSDLTTRLHASVTRAPNTGQTDVRRRGDKIEDAICSTIKIKRCPTELLHRLPPHPKAPPIR